MDKLARGFSRLAFHTARLLMVPLEAALPRLYMQIKIPLLRSLGLKMSGEPRYISSKVKFDEFSLVTVGERVVLSKYVILLTHDYSITTALITLGEVPKTDVSTNRPIKIGRNVFVGMGAIIMPGAIIGDDVIIGAGSVVRGTVPSNSIVLGNPGIRIGSITERAETWRRLRDGGDVAHDAL